MSPDGVESGLPGIEIITTVRPRMFRCRIARRRAIMIRSRLSELSEQAMTLDQGILNAQASDTDHCCNRKELVCCR